MHPLEALLLGVVQGLTEFLPISSSGHLIVVPWLGDIQYLHHHPHFNKTFDVALHLGTLAGVVVYFRSEIVALVRGFFSFLRKRRAETASERIAVYIAVATVPAAIVGAALQDTIDEKLGDPWQIAILLAVFALLLGWADRRPQQRDMERMSMRDAIVIGASQALALMPGVSRSGITITAARALHLERDTAARFSFLLLVPITAGAVLVKGLGVAKDGLPHGAAGPTLIGVAASAITGYFAIAFLLTYVRRHNYDVFVVYRLLAAAAIAIIIITGLRGATF